MRVRHVSVLVVGLLGGGCEPDAGARAVVARDSAGVRIVESREAQWPGGEGWRVEAEPFLVIGVVEGDSMQQLFRVGDAMRLSSGGIVVADANTPHVRWFDENGEFLRGAGRSGEGPGEFSDRAVGTMCVPGGGRLLVADPMQARANVFTEAGEFEALVRAPPVGAGFPSIQSCFEDGTLQLWHAEQPAERIPDSIVEAVHIFTRIDVAGAVLNELRRDTLRSQYLLSTETGGSYHSVPFTVRPSGVAGGARFFFTTGASAELEVRRPDGALESIWRWSPERTRSSDVLSRYERHTIDAQTQPDGRAQWAKFFDLGLDVPEYVAVTNALMASDDGYIWAERFRLPWDSASVWDVFEPEGVWLGGVQTPRMRVLEIRSDVVIGVRRDEDGVEQVVGHRIVRDSR